MSSSDPVIGLNLNEYQVLEVVAKGGMGVVYKGVHPVIGKRVAIKVFKAGMEKRGANEAQLAAEAKAVNDVSHENIVDVFGVGHLPDGRPYIIMEYLEGKPLDEYAAQRPLRVREVVQILSDVCSALSAAHAAKIIHRDLKPSNVFLCRQPDGGRLLKLLDFGLAKQSHRLDGVTEQTSKATVAGTPDFMAPEQAQGKAISPRTDLYSLGCIGYVLLTGELPFTAPTAFDVMVAHVRAPVPRASAKKAGTPPALDDLLFKLMQKKPDERMPSAEAVRDALLGILEELDQGKKPSRLSSSRVLSGEFAQFVPPPPPASTADTDTNDAVPAPSRSPRTTLLLVAGAVGLLVLGLVVALLVMGRSDAALPLSAIEAERAPSEAELVSRIKSLEARFKKTSRDPAALKLLTKFRELATTAETAEERSKLARDLSRWETRYLER